LIACSFFRRWSPSAARRISKRPKLFSAQMCRNPGKVNASGFPSPRSSRFSRAKRPNRISRAVLQGLVVCGICGSRMTIRYHACLVPEYVCQRDGVEYEGRMVFHFTPTSASWLNPIEIVTAACDLVARQQANG
jgi:hypothetical protein